MDYLTPMVVEARDLIPGDVLVNIGTVVAIHPAHKDRVFVECRKPWDHTYHDHSNVVVGQVWPGDLRVVRWAREGEV